MKRYGNLFNDICSIENLELADVKARKSKHKTSGVISHDKERELNISKLREALINKTFRTSQYRIFKIFEGKERVIYQLPYYPDRIYF